VVQRRAPQAGVMSAIDHAGKRLRRSGVRRHQLGAVKDPHEAILDEDLDMVAHQSMRHAVPDRVDVHKGVERHTAVQTLGPPRQRPERQRSKGRALVSLEAHDGRFTRRAVAPLIGDRHPLRQVLLERAEGVEGLIRQPIALDVFDARFGLPFGPRAIGRARTRLHVPVATEGDLRHTAATLLLAQGVDARTIMETLGHSQISLTMNTYSHVLPALQAEAAAKLDAILR
jgi:hypothetical protein